MKRTSFLIASALLLFAGCAKPTPPPKPPMLDEAPMALLVLPPINETTDAEAKGHYMTTIETPLGLYGYYVFPVELVAEVMKQEGVYDTELLYTLDPAKLQKYFGADAVMYTHIHEWDLHYGVIASTMSVSVSAEILSTKTRERLWNYGGKVVVDLTVDGGDGFAGLLATVVATAINSAMADYVSYAHKANARMLQALPFGPYHPVHRRSDALH
ncbi:MAG: DUF799 family lipoprotein [Campylobacterales bacterium]|nr:DUF799 family lipoprotein [Campylobacterales bacterium]